MGDFPANPRGPFALLRKLWDREIVQPLRDVDEESRVFLSSPAARGVDAKVIITLVTVAVIVTVQHYLDGSGFPWVMRAVGAADLAATFERATLDPIHGQLCRLLPFCVLQSLGFLVPALIVWLVFRERLSDYGTKLTGVLAGWWLYLLMIAVVMPFVVRASFHPSFRATYPYYRLAPGEPLWPYLCIWEIAYLLQFFFLEFFFRGFMLHATRLRFGCYSIFVMTIPYCMIHFGKPMAETLGAIIAGIALGFMSLKTRSIWLGTALHVTVAITMDLLALWHGGQLKW